MCSSDTINKNRLLKHIFCLHHTLDPDIARRIKYIYINKRLVTSVFLEIFGYSEIKNTETRLRLIPHSWKQLTEKSDETTFKLLVLGVASKRSITVGLCK
jgi:hypothetical protein